MEQTISRVRTMIAPGTRALVVDDSRTTLRLISKALQDLGFSTETAANGRVALEKVQQALQAEQPFDAIFSDISMPEMDGFGFCHSVQQLPDFNAPFVLVSTLSDANNVIKGLKLGADDFLPKPFDLEVVAKIVERVWH